MGKISSTLLSLLVLAACSSKKQLDEEKSLIHWQIEELNESNLSDLFDRVEYTQLDFPENVFMQQVDKVIIRNGKIYILDYLKSKVLYILDDSWKYITHIQRIGQGPGEYLSPLDFLVWNDHIEILDVTNKILFFNSQGEFQKEIKLPFNTYKFSKTSDSEYLLYTKESNAKYGKNPDCELVQFNISTNEYQCLLERPSYQVPFSTEREVLAENSSQTLFSKHFSDTIYSIDPNGSKPEYVLDFGKGALAKDLIDPTKFSYVQILEVLNNSEQAYHSPGLFASNNKVVTRYKGKRINHLIFDKTNNNLKRIGHGTQNDIDGGISFFSPSFITDEYVGSLIFPEYIEEVLKKVNNGTSGKSYTGFEQFAQSLDSEGPMVLVKYFFK